MKNVKRGREKKFLTGGNVAVEGARTREKFEWFYGGNCFKIKEM
jgi:hypothetical protein